MKVEESVKLKQFLMGEISILHLRFKCGSEGEGGVQNESRCLDCLT